MHTYATTNEVRIRIDASTSEDKRESTDPPIVESLKNILDKDNRLAKTLKMARDKFEGDYPREINTT